MTTPRAVLFDLDDTLYPHDRFRMSGFRAVAAEAAAMTGLASPAILDVIVGASVASRGRELQVLAERLRLGDEVVPRFVETIRRHVPDLVLPELSRAVLTALAPSWRLAIVTNGPKDIQARKIRALGLSRFVETIVFATEHGAGRGKPDAAPFLEACRQLAVSPSNAVFVGDDPAADIAGAHAVGMKTIWLPASIQPAADRPIDLADIVVASLASVPAAAARLVAATWGAHAA